MVVVTALQGGQNYTFVVTGKNGATGRASLQLKVSSEKYHMHQVLGYLWQ
jgi:hypothetical protein